jgi:hypothetical protein
LVRWLVYCLVGWPFGCLVGWLIHWLIDCWLIEWLVCQSAGQWVNLLKSTGYVMRQHFFYPTTVRSAHTVFMCFVFIRKQTATCVSHTNNWLVFITEMKSVYCAVRTWSLNKAVCHSSLTG